MNSQKLGQPATAEVAKAQAKRLRNALSPNLKIGHSQALELIARVHGEQSWGRLNSLIGTSALASEASIVGSTETKKPLPNNHIEQRGLKALFVALQTSHDTTPSNKTRRKVNELLKDEIVPMHAIEDYVDTLDPSIGEMVFALGGGNICRLAGIATVSRMPRPRAKDNTVMGSQGLRPSAFAAVLIWLERLGFDTHPKEVYQHFLDRIKRAKYLDADELSCLWHLRQTRRFKTHERFVDTKAAIPNLKTTVINGRLGLKIKCLSDTDEAGTIESLLVYRQSN